MIAADTNLLVRFLARDDKLQAMRAVKLIKGEAEVFIAKTVLLETAWVLRSAYDFEALEIINAFQGLGGLQNVVFEDTPSVVLALQWVRENSLDFADALHLATAQTIGAQPFYSFDQPLVKRARQFSAMEPGE
ncbi:MAG: type II toxin-antitoxin system VapC family toxin [Gammaproteobacteria bacterium]|nr:type II toxin-antitoxin system VapC family toxin [Gammaproteobacteria bacterium]